MRSPGGGEHQLHVVFCGHSHLPPRITRLSKVAQLRYLRATVVRMRQEVSQTTMVKMLVVRAGSTDFDEQGRIKGTLNIPLSEAGPRQVRRVNAALHPTDAQQ